MHSYRWCGSLPSTATTTTATTMIRRLCCLQSVSPSLPFSSAPTTIKKPLVLLGAPQVSAIVLDMLLIASASPHSLFEVAAIVTQPPARRDRGKKLALSPLANHALDRGFSPDLIFTPLKAGDDDFLSNLKALQPHLCITAAYGNILPTKFLDIPPLGTVNIHRSLLPLHRGVVPVQRALQDGVKETGVSLAFTVRALDAGPIIATETMQVDAQIKAPDLLELLFHKELKREERERHPINQREKHILYPVEIIDVPADTKDKDEILEKTGQGWRCEVCPEYDVCNACYEKDGGTDHPHKLTNHPSMADRDAQNKEARQLRVLQV
ncbi:methionyl-tRNA formyltransferase [Vigna unguiculata]|uniref:methionyl-tRNA formyltransferase n=1 Tax=Vigna unguiculata TaxID=3917 RepID=A0A4D6M3T0_VIGUN|nr:methionyl-tRNA formyltransferase [Vigna unguiculata]